MTANNAAQGFAEDGPAFFRALREAFGADARKALLKTIVEQVDLGKAGNVTPEWAAGPFGAPAAGLKPWLTPFHPAIEIAIYARLLWAARRRTRGPAHWQQHSALYPLLGWTIWVEQDPFPMHPFVSLWQ